MYELIRNPALIVGLVRSAMILAVSFGVQLNQSQQDAAVTFVGAVIAVLASLALTGVTVAKTTPQDAPVLDEGTTVAVVTTGNKPNRSVTL